MSELITVPTLLIEQEDKFGTFEEYPIQVQFYRDSICLQQQDRYVNIDYNHFEKIFKQIKKNIPEAQKVLDKK